MTVAGLLAGTAQRDALQERAVVADRSRLADDDAGAVVEHDADADAGGRIDIHPKDARALALQVEREVAAALLQQLVRETIRDEGMEALEVEQRLDVAAAGWIAVVDGCKIGPKCPAEFRPVVQGPARRSDDQPGIDVGMVQPLRETVADGILQPLLAEYGGI